MDKKIAIIECLKDLDDRDLIELHNEMVNANRYDEEFIYANTEDNFNERLEMRTPMQIVNDTKNWKVEDDYFVQGIYGIESFNSKELYEHINFDKLVEYGNIDLYISKADLAENFAEQYISQYGAESDIEDWAMDEDLFRDDWDEIATTHNEEEDGIICPFCGSCEILVESKARNKNDYTLCYCKECGNEFSI